MGILVKQYKLKQTVDKADWLIGAGILAPGVNGTALRNMLKPGTAFNDPRLGGKDPQPADMKHYVHMQEDEGGVHINSGIPNRAFATACMEAGGFAWDAIGRIWYQAFTTKLTSQAQFQDAANATLQVANTFYGAGTTQYNAVKKGWVTVGITPKG